jgi:hypothetical protein
MIRAADTGVAGCFENVRAFLQYVQGERGAAEAVPPAIVRDLLELEERTRRVQAITGLMAPVELSPYVLEMLRGAGGDQAARAGSLLNAAGD